MIELTQRKLGEAGFFLNKLSGESQRVIRREPEAFEFYLSAFLSAARAVTFALRYEEKDKYDAWFPAWADQLAPDDQALCGFMVQQRNIAEKRGGAETRRDWTYIPVPELRSGDRSHPAYGVHWFGPPGAPPPAMGMPVYYFEMAGQMTEVSAMYTRYFDILNVLVRDFIQAHGRG